MTAFTELLAARMQAALADYYRPGGEHERETAAVIEAVERLSGRPRIVDEFGRPYRREPEALDR